MKVTYLPFFEAANMHVKDASARSRILAAAVAVAISNSLPLPSTEVENVSSEYGHTLSASVARTAAAFNENVVFDLPYALELARALWFVRYTAAHPCSKPIYGSGCGFFETYIGVHLYVSDAVCEFLNEHRAPICILAGVACDVLKANGGYEAASVDASRLMSSVAPAGQSYSRF